MTSQEVVGPRKTSAPVDSLVASIPDFSPDTIAPNLHPAVPTIDFDRNDLDRKVDRKSAVDLSLAEISRGVGVAPEIEVYNGTVDGFDTRVQIGDEHIDYSVILYRPPSEGGAYAENNNDPETLSIQTRTITAEGNGFEDLVTLFRVPVTACDAERDCYTKNLSKAAALLEDPETFAQGQQFLETLVAKGVLEQETFKPQEERFVIAEACPDPADIEVALRAWLSARGVDTNGWGMGESKAISELAKEILSGEGVLTAEQGEVYLENRVVLLWLESPDGLKRLLEDHQIFHGGRVRQRRNLGGLPAEKMHPHEAPTTAVQRLCAEELNIHEQVQAKHTAISTRIEPSQCFPGIWKRNTYFVHEAVVPDGAMRTQYVERSSDKVTEFIWVPNPESAR